MHALELVKYRICSTAVVGFLKGTITVSTLLQISALHADDTRKTKTNL
jgi:hypothetical protein